MVLINKTLTNLYPPRADQTKDLTESTDRNHDFAQDIHYNYVDSEESDEECDQVQVLVYTGCILLGKCTYS